MASGVTSRGERPVPPVKQEGYNRQWNIFLHSVVSVQNHPVLLNGQSLQYYCSLVFQPL